MQEKEEEEILGTEKIPKLLVKFSVPCVIAMLVSALYNIVDQIFIGQGIGYLGNAATSVVYPFTVIALSIAYTLGDGTASLYSLSLGKKDYKTANKTFFTTLISSITLSLILTAIGFIFIDEILSFFGVTENSYQYALDYMRIILIGIPFYVIANSVNGLIRADGSPKFAMFSTLAGAIINIILDPIAIFVLGWGIKGAAIATILGQLISFILGLIYFIKPKNIRLSKKTFGFDFEILKREIKLGLTSFVTQISIVIIIAVTNNLIGIYGADSIYGVDIPLSVTGIVMKVFSIVISLTVGIAVGGQPIVGYNYGAEKFERVKTTYKYIVLSNLVIGIISFLIFELCPQVIVNLFGNESELYNEYARLCFRIFLGSVILTCVVKPTSIFLQSLGNAPKSIFLSLARDLLFNLPAMVIFAYLGGVVGMLWAPVVADVLCMIFVVIFVRMEFRKFETKADMASNVVLENISKIAPKAEDRHCVVTISREFGSGGRYIGKLVAEKLGVNFYDEEIISLTAEKSGLSEHYVKEFAEKKKAGTYIGNNDDRIFFAESKVIHDLAEKESCVIVGRCANIILQDMKDKINLVNIFIYNNDEGKVKRAVKYYGFDEKNALNKINEINYQRSKHFKYYTDREWKDIKNYDFVCNSDILEIDKAAEIITTVVHGKIDEASEIA